MLLNTISSLSCSGKQTWTNTNLRALYSDQGEAQSSGKLCCLFLLKVSSQSYRNIPHKDRGNERDRQWVSRRQWEEDKKKVSAACTDIDSYLLVHMGQRQEMCAFLFDYIGTEKLKDRHGMVEVLYRSAYFNCCTGVPNEETHSWIHLMLRV